MQELEKILEEIDETIERYGENPYIGEKVTALCYGMNIAKGIIRKYISGKDTDVPAKDDWIPVEERLPEEEMLVWVTVKHSSWISDYGSDFIPKEEWGYHPESSGTYKGKYEEGIWWYEDEVNEWIRCDGEPNEARDPGVVYDTVIAWQPIPEPYKGGQNET